MSASGVRFRVPHPRRALVERARLIGRLSGSADGMPRLLLLAAPAGFGKTTLLTQWLGSLDTSPTPPALAWLSVDASDRDTRHFITNLLTAIEAATDGVGGRTRALLEGDRPPHTEAALTQLIADLDDLATPLVIALDDFHAADSPETQSAVGFLLQHLPALTTVAMTTRADPSLPLSRMRARGELLEIRAADLRFTTTEAGEFLTDIMDLPLTDTQVSALESRTEGWPAGLQLAALSARTHPDDVARFVRDFTGSHRFVLDYLLDEVLAAEDESTRTFLLRTSILEHLSGDLCDALAGDQDGQNGQRQLERLEQRNLFVIPLDDTRHWFRYHHLFADALRARLLAESPDVVQDLHRSASTWHARHGLLLDAVRHAREAHDDGLTAYLVEAVIPQLRRQRLDQTIIDLVTPLSESVVRSLPTLATTRAWAHLAHGELDLVDTWLTAAEESVEPGDPDPPSIPLPPDLEHQRDDERRLVPGTVAIYRASLAQAAGDVDATVEHANRARDLARPDDHLLRASAAGFLGLADWVEGDLDRARTRFAETRHHLDAAGNTADALATSVPVAAMALGLGRPDLARRLLEQALSSAAALDGLALSSHADLHVALADVLREQGDLGAAHEHLAAARDLGDGASLPENRFRWYAVSADLLSSTGDHVGALDRLARAEELYLPGFFPDIQPLAARRARILLRQKRIDEARAWADEHGLPSGDTPTYRNEYAQRRRICPVPSRSGCRPAIDESSSTRGRPWRPRSTHWLTRLTAPRHATSPASSSPPRRARPRHCRPPKSSPSANSTSSASWPVT